MKQCEQFYNISAELLTAAVAQTNEYYGSYDIRSSRIVFPNGAIDPWHALGITQDITQDLPAVFIQGEKAILPSAINFYIRCFRLLRVFISKASLVDNTCVKNTRTLEIVKDLLVPKYLYSRIPKNSYFIFQKKLDFYITV